MTPLKLVFADDDPDIRTIYCTFLEEVYTVIEARDGIEAWKAIEEHRPRVVVTDLNMPGINGMELTKKIKASPDLKSTIVIVLTGTTKGDDLPPGFWNIAVRADKYLDKPLSAEKLLQEIRRQLLLKAKIEPLPPGKGYY